MTEQLLPSTSKNPAWGSLSKRSWASCPLNDEDRIVKDLMEIQQKELSPAMMENLQKNTRFTAGPAVKYAAAAIFNFYVFLLVYPIVTWQCAPCHEDLAIAHADVEQSAGLADVSNGTGANLTTVTVVAVICLFIHLVLQWLTSRFVIQPQNMNTYVTMGKFVFGTRPYGVFFAFMQILAMLNVLNVVMNAATMGRLLATKFRCRPSYAVFQELWLATNTSTSFANTDFLSVYGFFYMLQFAGVIFAMIYAIPVSKESDGDDKYGDGIAMYNTCWHCKRRTHAGAVTMVLASLARFELVYFQQDDYAHEEMHRYIQARESDRANRAQKNDAVCKAIELAVAELERGIAKCFIMGCLVNAFQGNWQVTLAAMNWHVSQEARPDSSLMAGVFFCFTSFFCDLQYIYGIVKVYKKARDETHEGCLIEPDEEETKRCRALHKQMKAKGVLAATLLGVYLAVMAWTLCKVLALYGCSDHIFNFGSGCVDFPHI